MSSTPAPFGPDAARVDQSLPATAAASRAMAARPYVAPAVTVLGSLSDLTLGGIDGGPDDGFGGSGATGSI